MRHMPANRGWWNNDRIPSLANRHEAIEIGKRTRGDPYFRKSGVKNFTTEVRCNHFYFFNSLKAHLIFIAWIAKRGARSETRG